MVSRPVSYISKDRLFNSLNFLPFVFSSKNSKGIIVILLLPDPGIAWLCLFTKIGRDKKTKSNKNDLRSWKSTILYFSYNFQANASET